MHAKPHHITTPINFHSSKHIRPPNKLRIQLKASMSRPLAFSTPINRPSNREIHDEAVAFWDYQSLFVSQRSEVPHPIKLELIDGALPQDFPSGTYYLNGPGLFCDDYGSNVSPLDGHGYVRGFEIDGLKGEVKFSAKYVKTKAQMEEYDPVNGSWRFTHRGPFSLLKSGKIFANTKVMKNVANTSILKWGGRLFCLWEGGYPYEIDPQTLNTIGSSNFNFIDCNDFGGEIVSHIELRTHQCYVLDAVALVLRPILQGLYKMPPKRLLAHYKIDVKRERLIVMTCNVEDMVIPTSHCIFYEFGVDFELLQKREFNISTHSMIHDWAFTDEHYILFTNRVRLDVIESMGAIIGIKPMISSLSIDHSKPTSSIYLLPRFVKNNDHSHDEYWKQPIEVPPLWLLHVANAYELRDNDGNLWVHIHASVCGYEWFNFQTMFGYNWQSDILEPSLMNAKGNDIIFPHLIKISIKLEENNDHPLCSIALLNQWSNSSDFPIINLRHSGYSHRYVYASSSSGHDRTLPHFPFDTVLKHDILNETSVIWSPGNRHFVGEPMFVSRDASLVEDDRYLLVVEYVASQRRCNLLILDAKRLGERNALCARFGVPKSLTFPLGFHGIWTPKV